ncbi:hypothetical protein [Micromonospora sp. NPDC126480]|uniref:hypothetical protein n=1 Tax=Micromonospora sp. NPDC126480 TaxID=3155312 RepID=UPI003331B38D
MADEQFTPTHADDRGARRAGRPPAAAVRAFGPWLAVLALVLLLSALRLRPLAAAVSLAWLAWCVWTWVRPSRRSAPGRRD